MIFGIDGIDFDYITKHSSALPFLNELLSNNNYPRLRSVFPADTTPAWSTIYTGLDPSEHGIINFVNARDKDNDYKEFRFEDTVFKGKTFWDEICKKGYKSVVIFPMNIKEGWSINGLMITRPVNGKIAVLPRDKEKMYHPNEKIMSKEIEYASSKQMKKVEKAFVDIFNEEYRVTKMALQNEKWDLFFSYFSSADGTQHAFWRNCDETHPEYPGPNPFKNTILNIYQKIDRMLFEFSNLYPDVPMIVVSDHGHGARPVWSAKINEMLKREGYLYPKQSKDKPKKKKTFRSFVRKMGIGFVKKFGLPKFLKKWLKKSAIWKKVFVSSSDFDWDKTTAYLSDLSAMKNYSYGGIRVIKNGNVDLDSYCDEIIDKLKKYNIPDDNTPAFLWIKRTNSLYYGEYLDKYPEIIFQLDERYGASWDLGHNIFEKKSTMHQFSPGAHRYETAYLGCKDVFLQKHQYEMTDIKDIICGYFE